MAAVFTPGLKVTEHTIVVKDRRLPLEGEVLVEVAYSSLNYKDGMAITGTGRIIRNFPMVPGIDLVGTVRESDHADWKAGDKVVLNGWGVGEGHWGGLAQVARLKGDWLVPLPASMMTPSTVQPAPAMVGGKRAGVHPVTGAVYPAALIGAIVLSSCGGGERRATMR